MGVLSLFLGIIVCFFDHTRIGYGKTVNSIYEYAYKAISISMLYKVCLATIGVCVFRCVSFGWRTFFILEEKNMKKVVIILSVLTLFLTISASAVIVKFGECGDNLSYELDDSGTLTISGTGDMYDWVYLRYDAPWKSVSSKIIKVIINQGVTRIGNSAFESCGNIKTITLPEGITSIGDSAFENCDSIAEITIPESITVIEENAFKGCENLFSVSLPNGLKNLGKSAFEECTSLTSINYPSSLTTIEEDVFYGCCSLTSFAIPDSVTSIGSSAFENCIQLTRVKLPGNLKSIGESAFARCNALEDMEIPKSVTEIGERAFLSTGFKSVDLPDNITEISSKMFFKCSNLINITIPEGVTKIGDYAFAECHSLSFIIIPSSVASVGDSAFNHNYDFEVYYTSSEEEWENITVGDLNYHFNNAKIHYNYNIPEHISDDNTDEQEQKVLVGGTADCIVFVDTTEVTNKVNTNGEKSNFQHQDENDSLKSDESDGGDNKVVLLLILFVVVLSVSLVAVIFFNKRKR